MFKSQGYEAAKCSGKNECNITDEWMASPQSTHDIKYGENKNFSVGSLIVKVTIVN